MKRGKAADRQSGWGGEWRKGKGGKRRGREEWESK